MYRIFTEQLKAFSITQSPKVPLKVPPKTEPPKTKDIIVGDISGPVKIEKIKINFPRSPDKTILLISDNHTDITETACQDGLEKCVDSKCRHFLPVVIDRLIQDSQGIVDFYIELEVKGKEDDDLARRIKQAKDNFDVGIRKSLMQTWFYYRDCYSINKENCKKRWKNLRYHYVDYRMDKRESDKRRILNKDILELYYHLFNYIYKKLNDEKLEKSQKKEEIKLILNHYNYKTVLNNIINIPISKENLKLYFKILLLKGRITKQLYSVHKYIRDFGNKLETFINKEIDERFSKIGDFIKKDVLKDEYLIMIKELIEKIYNNNITDAELTDLNNYMLYGYIYLSNFFDIVMDIYALTRIFRTFTKEDSSTEYQNNVIVYAGAYHIRTYTKFIKENFNFESIIEEPKGEIKTNFCINVEKPLNF